MTRQTCAGALRNESSQEQPSHPPDTPSGTLYALPAFQSAPPNHPSPSSIMITAMAYSPDKDFNDNRLNHFIQEFRA
ncbi:hypothetical protein M405DRAFT_808814 [Rhizopogon salebrosus TDB-379]|nr:hypothetical protein M405DRAFT_808814 [Rhizopogon salebrosus TDB-379]